MFIWVRKELNIHLSLKNLSDNEILTFNLLMTVVLWALKISHSEINILQDESVNYSLFYDWYYYSKSSKKDSKISSTVNYKIRVYISIKVTAKCHSHRECKSNKDSLKCRKYSIKNLSTNNSKGRYIKL